MLTAFVLGIILVLVHFFSEEYSRHFEGYHVHTISFSAGMFLGLIFLVLLPEAFNGTAYLNELVYILMIAGFVVFHLGEKYIYQHIKNKNELMRDLASVHAVGFFFNHFVVGITLFLVFSYESIIPGFLIFIPLLLHTFSSSLSLNHIDAYFRRKSISGILLPLSPLFGVAFATLLHPHILIYHGLFSFAIGSMLYISIRDMLPRKEKGKPLLFLIGALLSVLVVVALSVI